MSDLELHADYDQDGRVAATAAEHDARARWPGAILLPNLDVDGRGLPSGGSGLVKSPPPEPDHRRPTRPANDDDLEPVRVQVNTPAVLQDCLVRLGLGPRAGLLGALDASRHLQKADAQGRVTLPVPSAGLKLFVEARTLAGSPLLARPDDPSALVELLCEDLVDPGKTQILDVGLFTVAPLLLVADTAPAERIYIAEVDGNNATRADLVIGLKGITGVQVVQVPAAFNLGDSWIQDQFQMGYCRSPRGTIRVVLHLPRMRADAVQIHGPLDPATGTPRNLAAFVDGHFPSTGVGVFSDFWQRSVTVTDAAGKAHSIGFVEGASLNEAMGRVFSLRTLALHVLGRRPSPIAPDPVAFTQAREQLFRLVSEARGALQKEERQAVQPALRAMLAGRAKDLKTRLENVQGAFVQLPGDRIELRFGQRRRITLKNPDADILSDRLGPLHDSLNFGGNIEVTPAVPGAHLGKMLVGNANTPGGDMDPELLTFLRAQRAQPLVEIDTSWLGVAHVDEVLSVVPHPRGVMGFAVLRASPLAALTILEEARNHYRRGLARFDDHLQPYEFNLTRDRAMTHGSSPVTHLLRGRTWLHVHPKGAMEALEPPRLFQAMAKEAVKFSGHAAEFEFRPGEGADTTFDAHISIFELLHFQNGSNTEIEDEILAPLDELLRSELGDPEVFPLPVLFDNFPEHTPSAAERAADPKLGPVVKIKTRTGVAYTPGLVNLQSIGNRLLLPRAYGPRMRVEDVVAVMEKVLGRLKLDLRVAPSRGLFERLARTRALQCIHWQTPAGDLVDEAGTLANKFDDGFPGIDSTEVRTRILEANPQDLRADGTLRPGWRRILIPEETFDLFEAFTVLIAEHLGLEARFVDTWYYHLRHGELHCGTNVLRKVPRELDPWWKLLKEPE